MVKNSNSGLNKKTSIHVICQVVGLRNHPHIFPCAHHSIVHFMINFIYHPPIFNLG
jgi:hypothetical protein